MRIYRGKDKATGAWVEGGYVKHYKRTPCPVNDMIEYEDIQHLIINSSFSDWNMPRALVMYEVFGGSVGQDTLKRDKNKKRIFKGDVMSCGMTNADGEWEKYKAIVSYDDDWGMFVMFMPTIAEDQMMDCAESFEVLGRYYDDPNLLANYTE